MLPVVLDKAQRKKTGIDIAYKPYQFLPFMEIFEKDSKGFKLKKAENNQLIINDDFGIGIKTETGIILSQLLENDPELRVLIIAPWQERSIWKEEMYGHFGLDFHIYGENGKHDSDLLIADFGGKFDICGFDVQIICDANFYKDESKCKFKSLADESKQYLLRILIHSDAIAEGNLPCTSTSAAAVSGFQINKTKMECESEKDKFFKEYIENRRRNDRKIKAVIFCKEYEANENKWDYIKGFNKYFAVKKNSIQKTKEQVNDFCESKRAALLVCDYPWGVSLKNCCGLAVYYDILNEGGEKKSSGLLCTADRTDDVEIIYLAANEEDSDAVDDLTAKHYEKQNSKEQVLKDIEKKVESYIITDDEDRSQIEALKGE